MMKTFKYFYILPLFCATLILGCAEEEVGPVLGDSSTFSAPVLKSPATSETKVISSENASETFEEFIWEKPNYGISLATEFALEMDISEDFSAPKILATTTQDKASVSNQRFNDMMLSLGLPEFEESVVYLRVRSVINSFTKDTLYSNTITRSVTTYQSSECGNFCTIGLIGSATPGGWDNDIDMRLSDPEKIDKSTWETVVYLTGGQQVKFRANDDWQDNWGGSAFPEGNGEPGGSDITVSASGYYKVVFNDESKAYSFTLLNPSEFPTIGVIGDATPGGWETDTDLTKDSQDPHLWTGTITLTEGKVKFRANNSWDDNWGGATFPSGHGVAGGADIAVTPGTYFVRFNDASGEYSFMRENHSEPFASIGIIGTATSGGWDSDTDMIRNPSNPYLWSKIITLSEGVVKFRANDDWADNWGGSDFPGGIGAPGGADLPVKEGTYFVTFNSGTGEYYFLK